MNPFFNSKSQLHSHRAQVAWSLCVAAIIAFVAVRQVADRPPPHRTTASGLTQPSAPLSQEAFKLN